MPLIRPEAQETLWRWREVIVAGTVALFGLWLVSLGGLVLIPLGGLAIGLAAVTAVLGLRRMRFAQTGDAPGVVELDEGQIRYLGPTFGGSVAIPDLAELRLVTHHGRRLWRLKQTDGQTLLIPVEAVGAENLFDAFAALPGLNSATLVAALTPATPPSYSHAIATLPDSRVIWRRPALATLR